MPGCYATHDGYHKNCYKNFTAVPKQSRDISSAIHPEDAHPLLRSSLTPMAPESSGIFGNKCLFCPFMHKKVKGKTKREGLTQCETKYAQSSIITAAVTINDKNLLVNIRDIDFIAKEVKYHNSCRKNYLA